MPASEEDRVSPRAVIKQWLETAKSNTSHISGAKHSVRIAKRQPPLPRRHDETHVRAQRTIGLLPNDSQPPPKGKFGGQDVRERTLYLNKADETRREIDNAGPKQPPVLQTPFRHLRHFTESPLGTDEGNTNRRKIRRNAMSSGESLLEEAAAAGRQASSTHSDRPTLKKLSDHISRKHHLQSDEEASSLSSAAKPPKEAHNHLTTFGRRPRHKTREDKYELKVRKSSRRKKPNTREPAVKGKKRRRREKSGATLMHDFEAPNVSGDRLTLRPSGNVGIFGRGKSSSALPDLAFPRLDFLNTGRLKIINPEDKEQQRSRKRRQREQQCADGDAEMSRFFTSRQGRCKGSKRSTDVPETPLASHHEEPNLPPAHVELPAKPFLGFGSCGPNSTSPAKDVIQPKELEQYKYLGNRHSPNRSTSYFTWSQSHPRSQTLDRPQDQMNVQPYTTDATQEKGLSSVHEEPRDKRQHSRRSSGKTIAHKTASVERSNTSQQVHTGTRAISHLPDPEQQVNIEHSVMPDEEDHKDRNSRYTLCDEVAGTENAAQMPVYEPDEHHISIPEQGTDVSRQLNQGSLNEEGQVRARPVERRLPKSSPEGERHKSDSIYLHTTLDLELDGLLHACERVRDRVLEKGSATRLNMQGSEEGRSGQAKGSSRAGAQSSQCSEATKSLLSRNNRNSQTSARARRQHRQPAVASVTEAEGAARCHESPYSFRQGIYEGGFDPSKKAPFSKGGFWVTQNRFRDYQDAWNGYGDLYERQRSQGSCSLTSKDAANMKGLSNAVQSHWKPPPSYPLGRSRLKLSSAPRSQISQSRQRDEYPGSAHQATQRKGLQTSPRGFPFITVEDGGFDEAYPYDPDRSNGDDPQESPFAHYLSSSHEDAGSCYGEEMSNMDWKACDEHSPKQLFAAEQEHREASPAQRKNNRTFDNLEAGLENFWTPNKLY